jgi:hypothetical protein
MDNFFLVTFLFWPGIIIGAALLNMLISWAFSWSELIYDYLVGIVIGVFFMIGTGGNAGGFLKFLLIMSQGLFGLLYVIGINAFANRTTFFMWSGFFVLGSPLVAGALDRATVAIGTDMNVGGGFLSALIFCLKAPFSLITSGVGILMFLVGIFRSFGKNGRVGFLGGQLYVEWDTSSSRNYSTTLGCTIQTWTGQNSANLAHELYHSRQYIYLHDWLIPAWVLGGIWGLISSAIDGNFSWSKFSRADGDVGNPIEVAAYKLSW